MSANTVPVTPLSDVAAAPARPDERERHLRALTSSAARRRRSPLVGALIAVGIVLAIMVSQLGLSIAISQDAYESRTLETEQRDLARVEKVLSQNVDKLSSPQNLAENAAALGMVQNVRPATIRLSDGKIVGSLDSNTSDAQANAIPNSTLDNMPMLDAKGLMVDRDAASATANARGSEQKPVRWKGELPAPETH